MPSVWFVHGEDGVATICPPLVLTEAAVTKTAEIAAIVSILIIVSDQPGVIMLLLAITAQAVGASTLWFTGTSGREHWFEDVTGGRLARSVAAKRSFPNRTSRPLGDIL
jgi:hypothetical protein